VVDPAITGLKEGKKCRERAFLPCPRIQIVAKEFRKPCPTCQAKKFKRWVRSALGCYSGEHVALNRRAGIFTSAVLHAARILPFHIKGHSLGEKQGTYIVDHSIARSPATFEDTEPPSPGATLTQLREVAAALKNRHVVYAQWRFEEKLSLGKGLKALFEMTANPLLSPAPRRRLRCLPGEEIMLSLRQDREPLQHRNL
jgi:hypothetical protein